MPVFEPALVRKACNALRRRHGAWRNALNKIENQPHIRRRPGGYEGLFRIIIEQQVSVPSAQAILGRCDRAIGSMTPAIIQNMPHDQLKACGLSGPKIKYVKHVADMLQDDENFLRALPAMDDTQAIDHLCQLKGIGPWSAAIYLLFCEGRMDVWPPQDVALRSAWTHAAALSEPPAMAAFDLLQEKWSPYRGFAAHILWTYYAHLRNRAPI